MISSTAAAILLLGLAPRAAHAQVFADVETKNGEDPFGNFTMVLDHELAPFATANFIRLAEGLVSGIDLTDGKLRPGPFYRGLKFYAVNPGFEVACGSPLNNSTSGPGYTFRDDFRSTIPDQFAVIMDNNGPNTNGSRFFINLSSSLNPNRQQGRYSRFGQVILATNPPGGNGRATVAAISQLPPGFISISKLTMRYVGTAAQSFRTAVGDRLHPYLSALPRNRTASLSFRRTPSTIFLDWDSVSGSIAHLWASSDLRSWIGPSPAMNVPGSSSFGLDLASTIQLAPTSFFRGVVTTYPSWPSTTRPLANATIQTSFLDPAAGSFTSTYRFDPSGVSGTYSGPFGGGSFNLASFQVTGPHATRLELTPTSGSQPTYRLTLHFDLAWSSPIPSLALPLTANPSRLSGENLANPGVALQNGQWTYLAP